MANNDTDVPTEVQDTSTTDSSAVENNNPTVESTLVDAMKEDFLPSSDDSAESETDEATETPAQDQVEEEKSDEEASTEATDEDLSDEEMSQLSEKTQRRMRGLTAEKRQLQERIMQMEQERTQPYSVQDYVDAGYSEAQAEVQALRAEREAEKVQTYIKDLNTEAYQMGVEVDQDFPVFNQSSPDFDPDFRSAVDAAYVRDAHVQLDPTGQYVIRADLPLYEYYKNAAQWRDTGYNRGKQTGTQEATRQFAATDAPASARPAPKVASQDQNLDLLMQGLRKGLPK